MMQVLFIVFTSLILAALGAFAYMFLETSPVFKDHRALYLSIFWVAFTYFLFVMVVSVCVLAGVV